MTGVIRGDPLLLEDFTERTTAAVARVRATVDDYRAAVQRLNAAATDLDPGVDDLSAAVTAELDDAEQLDRQAAAYAFALRAIDEFAFVPGFEGSLGFGPGSRLFDALMAARLEDPVSDDETLLRRVWDVVVGFVVGDVFSFWRGDSRFFPGNAIAGANRVRRVIWEYLRRPRAERVVPTFANSSPGQRLAQFGTRFPKESVLSRLTWLRTPAAQTGFRWLGAAGGIASGALGTADLIRQGNPADAFRERGAGYVADVSGTAFGYASAAFFIAPNPVTAGAVVITGAVWVGAEVWDRWGDDVRDTYRAARDAAGDFFDRSGEVADRAAARGREMVANAAGSVLDGGQAALAVLNPFG